MKKILSAVALVVISIVPFAFSSNVFAASCPVGFTGPDSTNICTSVTTYACTVTNDTTVDVTNQNTQITVSGDATAGGNGAAGNVSTGSATNSNGTTFTATVTNGSCIAVATVPATPTPPAPTSSTQNVTAPKPVTATALPDTSSNTTPLMLAGGIAVLGAAAVVVRLVVSAYSRAKS